MWKGKFLSFVSLLVVLVLMMITIPTSSVATVESTGKGPKYGKVTPADQKAAAARFQAEGGFTAAAVDWKIDPNTGYLIPDYFTDANWAYSPLPYGSIGPITVTAGGSGYSESLPPTVTITDVYGPGVGATAYATVVGGAVTTISVDNPGSGYVAPVVTIIDASGIGVGATASAALDPATLAGGLRKFVDALPQLGPDGSNLLGQYIPIAVPSIWPSDGSDYYKIAVVEFSEQMHSDLPPTRLRGYVQLVPQDWFGKDILGNSYTAVALTTANGLTQDIKIGGVQQYGASKPHYMGPAIIAKGETEGRPATPVRVEFYNLLPTTDAGGDLFIPVDTTIMGSGMAPDGTMYSQNRATVHLHGTDTVWISDGTPHQWITPAGEQTNYPQGVSVYAVPDMGIVDNGSETDGKMTFYYTNQHSARLMFYHDHSYGITRLNVYVGEAAPYIVMDEVEKDLINGTNNTGVNPGFATFLPDIGIPLVIQDKTWVDANTILNSDPTWAWGSMPTKPPAPATPVTGDLWYPHVYVPAQNPWDPGGANPFGRWHYAAWFWPPAALDPAFGPQENPYYVDAETTPLQAPQIPGTPNPSSPGEAFMDTPVVNGTAYPYLEVQPQAYRFRILNAADDRFFNLQWYLADPNMVTTDGRTNTEVRMVPAPDGREGGIPDPAMKGPDWIQIGNEGGFLPKPVVVPSQPITWNGDPTLFNFGNVQDHSLLLGTAERADVIVDFSQYAGQTLILYNDAPAAFPALVPQYDYYTGNPDRMDIGGAPSTQPGFGPNVRTVMQVRVLGTGTGAGGTSIDSISLTAGGSAYTTPTVDIVDGGGAGAMAAATGVVDRIALNTLGTGYSAPAVTFVGGGGAGAAATAKGVVTDVSVTDGGTGYNDLTTTVTFAGGGGAGATATAIVSGGVVTEIKITNGGSSYTSAPSVIISDIGGGVDAVANATLTITEIALAASGSGYTSAPGVTISDTGGGVGAGAKATATLTISGITVNPPGSGYTVPPVVVITDSDLTGAGFGATAIANLVAAGIPPSTYNVPALMDVFAKGPAPEKMGVFEVSQDAPLIPSAEYNSAYNTSFPVDPYINQHDITATVPGFGSVPIQAKALQDEMGEVFDEYGRMMVQLGLELPVTTPGAQNFMMYGYASPPVEVIKGVYASQVGTADDGVQIWRITHNGVDTHTIHVHLFNAQLINRVAWDGFVYPPDPNELGWKETFRVNPLEHTIIALRAVLPDVPFEVPYSSRLIDPTMDNGMMLKWPGVAGFFDPLGDPVTFYGAEGDIMNHQVNYGWEYVYHCHLLAHEEMDMMHSVVVAAPPKAPTGLSGVLNGSRVVLKWTDWSNYEAGFTIQRAEDANFTVGLVEFTVGANVTTYQDSSLKKGIPYHYRVMANSPIVGDTMTPNFPTMSVKSPPTNSVSVTR